MIDTALLVAILVVLIGTLTAVKTGLNEIIKGLQAISDRVAEARRDSRA